MKRSTRNTVLILLAAALLFTPIYISLFSSVADYEGTDDKGSQIIESLSPESVRAETNPSVSFGYEPSDESEVWFFVGQIAIGIIVFGLGIYAMDRHYKKAEKDAPSND